ncbi:hypothetical protein HPB50_020286 [Hyalomma asiaticum]|uniref:Uncharacterized protein n=1 Tax=Hyalomma asiaticum TaxID=266040 RepID=A0ACB7SY59_HYAAI|nr:hypothetical protein HPB50_020286 [Hyalomma asiaticum]
MRHNRRVYPDPPHPMTRREAALQWLAYLVLDGLLKLKPHSRFDTFLLADGVPDTEVKRTFPLGRRLRKVPSSSTCSHENGSGTDRCLCSVTQRAAYNARAREHRDAPDNGPPAERCELRMRELIRDGGALQTGLALRDSTTCLPRGVAVWLAVLLEGTAVCAMVMPGLCPTLKEKDEFDLHRFMGTWYEVLRTPFIIEYMVKCVRFHCLDKGEENSVGLKVIGERSP